MELRRRLVDALACVRFYASGASDAGERADTVLAGLEPARDRRRNEVGAVALVNEADQDAAAAVKKRASLIFLGKVLAKPDHLFQ